MLASVRSHRSELLAFQIQQSDEFFNRPDVARRPRLHCGRSAQRLVLVRTCGAVEKECSEFLPRDARMKRLRLGFRKPD